MVKPISAVGRRKTSVARVYLQKGKGGITINGREFTEYFPGAVLQKIVQMPLEVLDAHKNFSVVVNVRGGGIHSQAEAVRHGMSRAFDKVDETNHPVLKANGLLRRDPRMVERKKFGKAGARRSFQFSKR